MAKGGGSTGGMKRGAKDGTKGYYPTPAEQSAKFDAARARGKKAMTKGPRVPKTGYEFERTWRSLRSKSQGNGVTAATPV